MEKVCFADNHELYYRDIGKGKPVLLIHGFAEDGTVWDALIPKLSVSYRLLIPDLPGSGRSSLSFVEKQPPSMETLADSIRQIVTSEKLEGLDSAPVLIGHSMGGYISLAYAEKYPMQWKALILFHSTAYADNDARKEARKKSLSFVKANGAQAFLKTTIPSFFSASFLENYPEKVDLHVQKNSHLRGDSLSWYYEAMIRRPDLTKLIKTCSQPIGFILGKEDKLIPPEQILTQAALPRISFHQILHHSGHMGMIEEPETVIAFLEKFLQEVYMPE